MPLFPLAAAPSSFAQDLRDDALTRDDLGVLDTALDVEAEQARLAAT